MRENPGPSAAAAATRAPRATYRLQLRSDFGLDDVRGLLDYLQALGVSDVYLSPLFRAREESSHGYDVVDHGAIDPAFGDLAAFERLAEAVRAAGMGILLDVVPNHMGINDPGNKWWLDVLEHGEESHYAEYFDIDWRPPPANLQHKILLPFLGEPFGEALESGKLQVVAEGKRLQLAYGDRRFPLARSTWSIIDDHAAALLEHSALGEALARINGQPGDPKSFDDLERLLDAQHYRLAYWRVASDEINYRRFFDINDLAAIRVENPQVFEEVHRLVALFLEKGWVTGLRIDHPDGLFDPEEYFKNLHALYRTHRPASGDGSAEDAATIYIVAEKILSGDEQLPPEWLVDGTTGYDLLNQISRLLVHPDGVAALRDNYERLTGVDDPPAEAVYQSKLHILVNSMSSELQVLAAQLYRIAQDQRASRDFTFPMLRRALREVIACMAVYRTYVRPKGWDVRDDDYRQTSLAVRLAKRRNRTMPYAVFDFIASVLLLQHPPTLSAEQADQRRRFVLKLQQVTGPVTAKGLEDTAFYRYYPLASLNEVGGELDARPLPVDEFHRLMGHRAASWPHSLSATATHDTKRGEDFRARLHVLSEIPKQWMDAVVRWQRMNEPFTQEVEGEPTPDFNAQYLYYQTLVGTWPLDVIGAGARPSDAYVQRITQYMEKALREAKLRTSWMSPSEPYEQAVQDFIRHTLALDEGRTFRAELDALAREISTAGFINGLTQLLLKVTLPGVPDFYQGTELWDFNLVDPDNRRPVDFEIRRRALAAVERRYRESPSALAEELMARWPAPEVKLLVAWRALQIRAERPALFAEGGYAPLAVSGANESHVIALARGGEGQWVAVVAPRHVQCLPRSGRASSSARRVLDVDWQDTAVTLPAPVAWRHELTGQTIRPRTTAPGECWVPAGELLAPLPVALLTSQPG